MANFEFDLEHDLRLTIAWKHPPSCEDEAQYRRNVEMAVQEMAIRVGIFTEEQVKPIVAEMVQMIKDLWLKYNPKES